MAADLNPNDAPWPRTYPFPKPCQRPQSGHCQVMRLQVTPQMFSAMQAWQMLSPQRQVQQKGTVWLQQQHR